MKNNKPFQFFNSIMSSVKCLFLISTQEHTQSYKIGHIESFNLRMLLTHLLNPLNYEIRSFFGGYVKQSYRELSGLLVSFWCRHSDIQVSKRHYRQLTNIQFSIQIIVTQCMKNNAFVIKTEAIIKTKNTLTLTILDKKKKIERERQSYEEQSMGE